MRIAHVLIFHDPNLSVDSRGSPKMLAILAQPKKYLRFFTPSLLLLEILSSRYRFEQVTKLLATITCGKNAELERRAQRKVNIGELEANSTFETSQITFLCVPLAPVSKDIFTAFYHIIRIKGISRKLD
jgi:hypothetical protein